MKKYDCLDRNTQIIGNHFLEASAGTGKTFAIEHLFVRLLIESKHPLLIDEILVVTFTKAATRDLRDRIRKNIQKVLHAFQEEEILFDYLRPFFQSDEKKVIAQRHLQEALYFFDRCQIFTIHSFCFRMLQEYRYSANVLIEKNVKDQSALVIDEIKSYFFHKIESSVLGKSQLSFLLQKHTSDKALLKKIIYSLDSCHGEDNFSLQKYYHTFLEKSLKLLSEKAFSIDEAKDAFTKIFPSFKKSRKIKEDEILDVLEKFLYVIENKACSLNDFDVLVGSLNEMFSFFSKENQKKKIPENIERNFLYQFIQKAYEELEELLSTLNNSSFLIKLLAKELSSMVEQRLKIEEAISHDDLLKLMYSSLEKPDFVESIKARYKAAIIDEFQDTDKLQWNIFAKLFLHKKSLSSFFLVGDPKQAIYRFRKADLYTYFQASDVFGKQTKAYLDTNYRSSPNLLNALNRLFSNDMVSAWLSLPKMKTHLPYLPVKASEKEQMILKDEKKAVHFLIKEDPSHGLKGPSEEIESILHEKIANEIVRLKEINTLDWDQIAILVKDRYQSERLKIFLEKSKIPYQSKSHILLGETDAAKSLLEVFEAIVFPKDLSKVKLAMTTPYFRCDSIRLNNLSDIEKEKIQYIFHRFHHLLKMKKMSLFLTDFLHTFWDGKTILERITSFSSLSFYQETIQILQDLLERFPNFSFSLDGIFSYFDSLKDQNVDDEEKKILQAMHDEKGVQILTIHMSKGLEFDIVFALGATIRSPVDEELTQEEIDELDAEKLRQFYVAMTRAKIRVYLPIVIDTSDRSISNGSATLNELFFAHVLKLKKNLYKNALNLSKQDIIRPLKRLIDEEIISIEELQKEKPIYPSQEKSSVLLPAKKMGILERKRFYLSFSSLVEKHEKTIIEDENERFLFSSQQLPPGSDTGVIIHEIFEKIFLLKDLRNKDKYLEIIKEVTALSSLREKKDILYTMVEKTLSTPLLPCQFALQDLDPKQISIEMEFLFPLPKRNFMKGFIDLVFCHQNKYYILDWKTNWLGNNDSAYDLENLKMAMKSNQYDLQAAIYAETLRRYFKWKTMDQTQASFGGIFYIFLRGINSFSQGIYHFYPEKRLLDRAEDEEKILCLDF